MPQWMILTLLQSDGSEWNMIWLRAKWLMVDTKLARLVFSLSAHLTGSNKSAGPCKVKLNGMPVISEVSIDTVADPAMK